MGRRKHLAAPQTRLRVPALAVITEPGAKTMTFMDAKTTMPAAVGFEFTFCFPVNLTGHTHPPHWRAIAASRVPPKRRRPGATMKSGRFPMGASIILHSTGAKHVAATPRQALATPRSLRNWFEAQAVVALFPCVISVIAC